ncbi:PadR family transcriptional regulator [Kineosporia sp. A_224]|uniref:PadR family transcriptional regulator n=1 Tax=Kineosporia sp. A_224 TaxID=1962180 RepID=UPI000B4BB561|nr:PadR family transcriptional regulator [Kineosporia sp. A_224]
MSTADVVLALLSRGPAHGYDLKRGHDTWFDQGRPLAFGQVYATLARLERDGLAAVAHTETGGGPERTVYEITPAGRARLAAWVAEPAEPAAPGADELIRKTVAALRLGLDPAGFVARQRAAHLRRMRALEQTPATDPTSRLVVEHAVAHLDADLRWLEVAAGYVSTDGAAAPVQLLHHVAAGDHSDDSPDDQSDDSPDDHSDDRSRA